MLLTIFNHFRLTWRLVVDRRVSWLLKLFLVGVPVGYALFPLPDDVLPVIGFLDDVVFLGLSTLVFMALCPTAVSNEHRLALLGKSEMAGVNLDAYRHPSETQDLAVGFAIIFGLGALGGSLVGLLGLLLFGIGYLGTSLARGNMLGNAVQSNKSQLPELYQALQDAQHNLPQVQARLFITQNPSMNAFTFGYNEPYTIVLTSGLVEKLTLAEIQAVIGHELGHILFGHVRLTSLMSGLGGIFTLLFYRWSRSCEYSADAIALLACQNKVEPVVAALIKITSGLKDTSINLQAFLSQIDGPSQAAAGTAEFLSTHPLISNRIRRLVELSQQLSNAR